MRDSGPRAGEPHQPVSPSTFTNVDALPGVGMTGGVVGAASGFGSGFGMAVGGGVVAMGTVSMACCGAVGEPPPHWLKAIALPSRSAKPNAGLRRGTIGVLDRSYR